jgi:hypothetical protein
MELSMCKTNNHDLAAEVWHIKEPQKLHRRHDQNARDLVGAQHDEPEGPRDADNRVWLRAAGRRSGGLRAGDIDAQRLRLQDDVLASNVAYLCNTREQHGRFHFAGEMRVHVTDARSASDGRTPKDRTPDCYRRRTDCKRLEDIDAASNTAIQNNRRTTLDSVNRCPQH